jgi:radical SAM protein with 4Fe4S-binding SPASM domain
LPQSRISIATNCGLYEPARHAFLLDLADDIGVHVEAITPETYDALMHPLKAERVFPRIVSLLRNDMRGKVHITTPVHRKNLSEISKIKAYFAGYGTREPHFTQIGNRSWESGPWAELALRPTGGFCFPDDLRTFVIDWDGAVLACCLDFSKSARLGDLRHQSIREVLAGRPWLEMFEIHRTKNWARKSACSRCRTDKYDDVQKMIEPLLGRGRQLRFPVSAFSTVAGTTRVDEGCIDIDGNVADGIVIYGPYKRLAAGRYSVSHLIEVKSPIDASNRIDLDVVKNGRTRTAVDSFPIREIGPLELKIDFESDGSITEFRISKVGVQFTYRGAIVQEIAASKEML